MSDALKGPLQSADSRLDRLYELASEVQTHIERLQAIATRLHRDVHPLADSLERLLTIPIADERTALESASSIIKQALTCDEVDVFLPDATSTHLVAMETGATPPNIRPKTLGLHRLPVNGRGHLVDAFRNGVPYVSGREDLEGDGQSKLADELGVNSLMVVPFQVRDSKRGILVAAAVRPYAFDARKLHFLELASNWVALVIERLDTPGVDSPRTPAQGREADRLTARQREVALLIARGHSNLEMARELVLTPGTVANHVAAILTRLGVTSRTHIAVWAVQNLADVMPATDSDR